MIKNYSLIIFIIILKALKIGVVDFKGIWEDMSMYQIIRNIEYYNTDLFAKNLVPVAGPIVQYLYQYLYDIPIFHLIFWFIINFFVCFTLSKIISIFTNKDIAKFLYLSVFMMLIPDIFRGNILVMPTAFPQIYLTFRDISVLNICLSIYFILNNKIRLFVLICSINFYIHPTSTINIFILITLSYIIANIKDQLLCKNYIKNITIFILAIIPKLILLHQMYFPAEIISFTKHWEYVMLNEPDDISTSYWIKDNIFSLNLLRYHIIFIVGIWIILYRKLYRDPIYKLILTIVVAIPLLNVSLLLYELVISDWMLERINDYIMPLQFRRMLGVIPVLLLPIIFNYIIEYMDKKIKPKFLKKIYLVTIVIFSLSAIHKCYYEDNISKISKLLTFDKKDADYFYSINNYKNFYFIADEYDSLQNKINREDYIKICKYIDNHFKKYDAFINPPYIADFRYLANRQGFLNEKNDGNYAGLNRKYGSYYYEQLEDLINFKYSDLNDPMFEGGENYLKLRSRYLKINEDTLKFIKEKYNYNLFITENSHNLDFEILYTNNSFKIYQIK